jgi:hypothetical protein
MASLYLLSEADEIGSDAAEAHCARLVVTVYTAVMASSRSERGAFNAAVQTYRAENPDLLEEDCSPGRRPDHLLETVVN